MEDILPLIGNLATNERQLQSRGKKRAVHKKNRSVRYIQMNVVTGQSRLTKFHLRLGDHFDSTGGVCMSRGVHSTAREVQSPYPPLCTVVVESYSYIFLTVLQHESLHKHAATLIRYRQVSYTQ